MLCFHVTVHDDERSGRRQPTGCTRNSAARATSWFAVDGSKRVGVSARKTGDLTEIVTKRQNKRSVNSDSQITSHHLGLDPTWRSHCHSRAPPPHLLHTVSQRSAYLLLVLRNIGILDFGVFESRQLRLRPTLRTQKSRPRGAADLSHARLLSIHASRLAARSSAATTGGGNAPQGRPHTTCRRRLRFLRAARRLPPPLCPPSHSLRRLAPFRPELP